MKRLLYACKRLLKLIVITQNEFPSFLSHSLCFTTNVLKMQDVKAKEEKKAINYIIIEIESSIKFIPIFASWAMQLISKDTEVNVQAEGKKYLFDFDRSF